MILRGQLRGKIGSRRLTRPHGRLFGVVVGQGLIGREVRTYGGAILR